MPGNWIRSTRTVSCTSLGCERSMVRDEPVYLVAGVERNVVCKPCALRRFQLTPPDYLPNLPPLVAKVETPHLLPQQMRLRDSVEDNGALARFDRAAVAGTLREQIKKTRQQQRQENAHDPRLKQLGRDA